MDSKDFAMLERRLSQQMIPNSLHFGNVTRSTSLVRRAFTRDERRSQTRDSIRRLEIILQGSPHIAVTLDDMARFLNMERTHCCRVFQKITGQSFSAWLRRIRIEKAQELLRQDGITITDVAHVVGYEDITTFSRNFRKMSGLTPTTDRKLCSDEERSMEEK